MKFSLWLERRGARDAVLGVLGADPEDRDKVMGRKTTYFGSEIRAKIKGLGAVKNAPDYGDIVKGIDDGITVGELVRRIGG